MLFLWIGSQNDRVFLFGSGYRYAGSDTVIIKMLSLSQQHCHGSHVDVSYCVNGFRADSCHYRAPFVLVVVVALFMVPVFIYFFQ